MTHLPLPFCLAHLLDYMDVAAYSHRHILGCEQILARARDEIREQHLDSAQAIITDAGSEVWQNAECLNVLGVIAEARGHWETARRLWGRAALRDPHYEPPRQNLKRYFELFNWGRCCDSVAFGDEPRFQTHTTETTL